MLVHNSKSDEVTECDKDTKGMPIVELPCNCPCCQAEEILRQKRQEEQPARISAVDLFNTGIITYEEAILQIIY